MILTIAPLYSETARQYDEYNDPETGAHKLNSPVLLLFMPVPFVFTVTCPMSVVKKLFVPV